MKTKLITSDDQIVFNKLLNDFISKIEGFRDIKFSTTSFVYPTTYEGNEWGYVQYSALIIYFE